jgi:hypothetical protein
MKLILQVKADEGHSRVHKNGFKEEPGVFIFAIKFAHPLIH